MTVSKVVLQLRKASGAPWRDVVVLELESPDGRVWKGEMTFREFVTGTRWVLMPENGYPDNRTVPEVA